MTDYKIRLDIFEGPLDLLLHLIKEDELNINDIPIAKITKQYFEYLDLMKDLNLDIAGEFLVMAATLTLIKSKTLLPPQPSDEEDEEGEDPKAELVRRLIEYKKFKNAAVGLREREMTQSNTFSRTFLSEWDQDDADYLQEVSVFQLLASFRKVLKSLDEETLYEITLADISVTEKMNYIMERLEQNPRLRFEDLFEGARQKIEIVGTFLAMLELMKQKVVRVFQEKGFGAIWVQRVEESRDDEEGEEGASLEATETAVSDAGDENEEIIG